MRLRSIALILGLLAVSTVTTSVRAEEAAAAPAAAAAEAPVATPSLEGPVLVTDVGQGNTSKLVEVMLKRAGKVEFTHDALAKSDQLAGKKTLVIGVGASTKGMGAAGLDADTEMARTKDLIAKAKEAGVKIVGVHIGGESRRGDLSDGFNRTVAEASDVFIAWSKSDEDGFFKALCETNKIPYVRLEDNAKNKTGEVITGMFAAAEKAE